MKILLLFALFISQLFSNEFSLQYYKDDTNALKLEDVQKIKAFTPISNKISLGYINSTVWFHLQLKNRTNKEQEKILYITEINIDEIDIFVSQNKETSHILSRGIARVNDEGIVDKSYLKSHITIKPHTIKDIYIKTRSSFPQVYEIKILSNEEFLDYITFINSMLYSYFGAMAALLLYNLFLYIYLKDTDYALYILFVFFFGLSQYHLFALYPFDSFSSVETGYAMGASHIFWFAFHTLFSRKILNIKNHYPKIDKGILYIGYFLLFLGFIAFFNLSLAIKVMNILMLLVPPFIFVIAVLIYKKSNKAVLFYLIAQVLFISSSVIFGLLYAGVLEYSFFARYINLAGSLSEAVLFSLALAYKTHILKLENQKQKELVDEYSKLSFLGQTVINIYHQWKSPVNNIYNSINHIETAKEFEDKDLYHIINENLEIIKQNTQYLKDTSTNYLAYYKGIDQPKMRFNLKDEIETIIDLHRQEFDNLNISTSVKNGDVELFMQKNIFTNILIILVENAISTAKLREVKNPILKIISTKKDDEVIIKLIDNLGGIKEKNINDIFEKNHSVSSSTGLGLYLVKDFLLPKVGGEIEVVNLEDGACFTIYFKSA